MMRSRDSLRDEYTRTLVSHLAKADEATLHHAYEIGRGALSDGLGVLDLVSFHHDALSQCEELGSDAVRAQKLAIAAEFLAESLSSFEMTLRGYREANVHLAKLNETLQAANAATEAANRELETFSYSVAHDLRAPLRSIDCFGEALLEDYADKLDEDGKQQLRYVREAAREMAELIDGLLTLSRVMRNELLHDRVDLSELARVAIGHLRAAAPQRVVETKIASDLAVAGDARLLRLVLENLLGNAWKFTKNCAHPAIEFGASGNPPQRVYFVRDNGAGFDMAHAAKLFGVFQRLHPSGQFEGHGIGLATVQRIINRQGGRVWAQGEVGRGATFYFTLWDPKA
jgi:light-regulated signal transduction histidine kinase (bacteriophytochrome)